MFRAARRTLSGAIALPGVVAALGASLLVGPWSPLALDAADSRYAAGDVAGAESAYVAEIEGWRAPGTRAEAARRAGLLALARGDARTAAERLRRAVDLEPDVPRRAELRVELGAVYRDRLRDTLRAAEELDRAAQEAPRADTAMAAARCWEDAAKPAEALGAWTLAAQSAVTGAERAAADAGLSRVEQAFAAVTDAAQ